MTRHKKKESVTSYAPKEQPTKLVTPKAETVPPSVLPVDPVTLMPDISLRVMKPGASNYDEDKDTMIVGFKLGNKMIPVSLKEEVKKIEDVTPYHFLTDPATGLRPGMTTPPHDCANMNISRSIGEWDTLPPLAIWRAGKWLTEIVFDVDIDEKHISKYMLGKIEDAAKSWPKKGLPPEIYQYYIVSGEGTPGNNFYRIYELPQKIAENADAPKHPLMWSNSDFDKGFNGGQGYKSWGMGGDTKPSTGVVTKAKALPAGVRMRCIGCGHWFKEADLPGHAQVCATTSGGTADWAMMCCAECGCHTLDQASTPKAGFPRPKPEPKVEEPKAEIAVADGK